MSLTLHDVLDAAWLALVPIQGGIAFVGLASTEQALASMVIASAMAFLGRLAGRSREASASAASLANARAQIDELEAQIRAAGLPPE